MKIDAIDGTQTGKSEVVGEARESFRRIFGELQPQLLVELADERGFRRLARIDGAAETSPMVRVKNVRPGIAQLQKVPPVPELNECGRGVFGPQLPLLGSGSFARWLLSFHAGFAVLADSRLRRSRTRPSQTSFDKSVVAPFLHSCLKCAYSSVQVGSSCTSVTASSGGRPLGSTRVRRMNTEGPHLHSESICAVPRSARMSPAK